MNSQVSDVKNIGVSFTLMRLAMLVLCFGALGTEAAMQPLRTDQRISSMTENRTSKVSSLAFIDTIIAEMEQKIASKMAQPQVDMQMLFIKKLRAQLEQNCSAIGDEDFSAELAELRQLQVQQSVLAPPSGLANPVAQRMLALFR
jgi:hypothetical protein